MALEYIVHSCTITIAACGRRTYLNKNNNIYIYRLQTFTLSMWGSLRLAPITHTYEQLLGVYVHNTRCTWRVKETASIRCTVNSELLHKIISNLNFFCCYSEDKIITIYHTCMYQTGVEVPSVYVSLYVVAATFLLHWLYISSY